MNPIDGRPASGTSNPFRFFLPILLALASLVAGCAVQLIADYDEFTFDKVAQVHEQCEALFLALEEAALTPDATDDLYPAHASAYHDILVSLRVLETRAAGIAKNEITTEQVTLLLDSMQQMQATHRQKSAKTPPEGLSLDTVRTLRGPMVQQFRAIFELQRALERGA